MGDRIDELISEIIVDAYGEHEQLWSFRQAFEDDARFPFRGRVVGAEVDVTEVDFDGDERRGLIA
ncbi:MAG: calcium-binding protein, partial [Actinobacteria bacterium]|nr:calcium-binding protein [Actinomycetota bacterium]